MTDKPRLPLPPGRPLPAASVLGNQPLPAGERVEAADLTKAAAAIYERDAAALAGESPVDPATPPIVFDEADVPQIEDLEVTERAELLAKIRAVRAAAPAAPPAAPPPDMAIPGMADAMAAADATNSDIPPVPDASPTGLDGKVHSCPRCRLDLTAGYAIEPSRADKLQWLASLYGARFRKEYPLVGGQIRLVFRSLTPTELTAIYDQAQQDMTATPTAGIPAYYARVFEYQLALQLESIALPNGVTLVVPADRLMAARGADGAPTNGLPALLAYVRTHVLKSDSLSRLAARKGEEFRRLVEHMEAAADDPDFMAEIDGRS